MPSISEVADNAKKYKKQIAEEAGVKESAVNDKNLKEVSKALDGAKVVAAQGEDPSKADVSTLKQLGAPDEEDKSSKKDLTNQNKIAMVIASIAPMLVGYAFGGNKGGAIGAKATSDFVSTVGKQEQEKEKYDRELADKKEARQTEIASRSEEKEKDRQARSEDRRMTAEAMRGNRELSDQFKQMQIDKFKTDQEFKGSMEGRMTKLGAEGKQRLDNARMGLQSVQGMADALLTQDQNTFSLVGDNDFTQARTMFEEALGRMQSGGAISKDEERRFKSMAPTWKDDAPMQRKKLALLQNEMATRIGTLGFKPDEFGIAMQDYGGGGQKNGMIENPLMNKANAGAAPDFDNMSEDELKKYLGN